MKSISWLLRVLVTYLIAWLLSYLFYVGPDFQFVADYWVLFWRGGGELPVFIQLTSWLLTLVTIGVWVGLRFIRRRKAVAQKSVAGQ